MGFEGCFIPKTFQELNFISSGALSLLKCFWVICSWNTFEEKAQCEKTERGQNNFWSRILLTCYWRVLQIWYIGINNWVVKTYRNKLENLCMSISWKLVLTLERILTYCEEPCWSDTVMFLQDKSTHEKDIWVPKGIPFLFFSKRLLMV